MTRMERIDTVNEYLQSVRVEARLIDLVVGYGDRLHNFGDDLKYIAIEDSAKRVQQWADDAFRNFQWLMASDNTAG